MRVLHVINSLILAGVEVLLTEMAPRFQERGIEVAVAVLKTLDSPLERRLKSLGIPFVSLGDSDIYRPDVVFSLAAKMDHYDVVHSYLFPAQLWVAAAAALNGRRIPVVTTEQSTNNRRRRACFRWLDRWMYQRYCAIACNSEATAENLAQWVPEVADRISVVYNGVPVERFREAEAAKKSEVLPGSNGRPVLIFVARFEGAKDHATLLRALTGVAETELVLVGDGILRPDMEQLARELGIAERVCFLGRRPDIPELLKMADVYVHSSNYEGFGMAAVEAMSAGLPVIASDVPGLAQIVEGAGLLFSPGDDKALAHHISSVLSCNDLRAQLSAASLRRADRFSIERTVDSFVEIYHAAVEGGKRGGARESHRGNGSATP